MFAQGPGSISDQLYWWRDGEVTLRSRSRYRPKRIYTSRRRTRSSSLSERRSQQGRTGVTGARRTRTGLVVALDGPGSSGKSSVGAAAALELGYRFCDTGLLYRAATWLALQARRPG